MKIKKEVKTQANRFPLLKVRYTLMAPFMGLVDVAAMIYFYMSPVTRGSLFLKGFYIFFALVGFVFACWSFYWLAMADGKKIRVRPVLGKSRELSYSQLKMVKAYKKKKADTITAYDLIDKDGERFVRIYSSMQGSASLLERLKQLNVPVEEVTKQ